MWHSDHRIFRQVWCGSPTIISDYDWMVFYCITMIRSTTNSTFRQLPLHVDVESSSFGQSRAILHKMVQIEYHRPSFGFNADHHFKWQRTSEEGSLSSRLRWSTWFIAGTVTRTETSTTWYVMLLLLSESQFSRWNSTFNSVCFKEFSSLMVNCGMDKDALRWDIWGISDLDDAFKRWKLRFKTKCGALWICWNMDRNTSMNM